MTLQDLQDHAQVRFKTGAVWALRLESSMPATGCASALILGSFRKIKIALFNYLIFLPNLKNNQVVASHYLWWQKGADTLKSCRCRRPDPPSKQTTFSIIAVEVSIRRYVARPVVDTTIWIGADVIDTVHAAIIRTGPNRTAADVAVHVVLRPISLQRSVGTARGVDLILYRRAWERQ
jgi:hypothetical protein